MATVNISPMGPIVDTQLNLFVFRPYQTSTTYKNLKRTGQGIYHITDDVNLFAQSALGTPDPLPPLTPSTDVEGKILANCCRWYAFEVNSIDDQHQRTQIVATTKANGRNRDFIGFNRAKHAVLEAAILATRLHILPPAEIQTDLHRLATHVAKTANATDQQAFDFLRKHIEHTLATHVTVEDDPEIAP